MYEFSVVRTGYEELVSCFEVLNTVFPNNNKLTINYLSWLYNDNPFGQIVGFNAYKNDRIVAHYVTTPIKAIYKGVITDGLLSLNTATLPEHQGKGLFTKLAELTYDHAYKNGFKFVCGVANINSTPGFINKLGFQLVSPLTTKVGFGKISTKHKRYDYSFKRIWNDEFLQWRLNNPSFKYWRENDFIISKSGYPYTNAIIGWINNLSEINVKIQQNPMNIIKPKLYIGIDENISFGKFFFDIPSKFRPVPLNFVFRDLNDSNEKLDRKDTLFQLIDFDIL